MKLFLSTLLLVASAHAGLVNAIALVVNGEPITLQAIETLSQQAHIDKKKAQLELTKQMVAKKMAKGLHIEINPSDVERQIAYIMKKNKLTRETLNQQLALQGMTYEVFFEQIEKQQMQQRIAQALTYDKVKEPTLEAKKEFYELHKKEFALPENVEVTQYVSTNKNSLDSIVRSPLFAPRDVMQENKVIDLKTVDPKLAQLLISTPKGSYTQILPLANNQLGMFYIKSIGEKNTPKFDAVKNRLGQVIQNNKRQSIIAAAYKEAILKADIEYIRVTSANNLL